MGTRAAVAGASGYAGGELLRLVTGHPDLEIGPVTGGASAGRPVTDVHPHLPRLAGHSFAATTAVSLSAADLVFLALPAGKSAALAAQLPASLKVVDLGPDFRLADPAAWGSFYQVPHAGPVALRPARAARSARANPVRQPGRRAGLLRHGGDPRPGAAAGRGPGRAVRHRDRGCLGRLRRGAVGQAGTARQRGDGRGLRLPGRRRAPAHARDRAGAPPGRGTGGGPGLLHAAAGPDAARHPGHLHRPAGPRRHRRSAPGCRRQRLRRRAVRAPAARGPLADHRRDRRVERRLPPGTS